ncbi:hypothetical protein [Nocardia mikamii]|uniref:hypothetical protein n=1 Tax=Nocardia mikamii TaxID=508464 RepID=UPI0007A4B3CB|nr:hypothetical protein [Nocardia mikamii]
MTSDSEQTTTPTEPAESESTAAGRRGKWLRRSASTLSVTGAVAAVACAVVFGTKYEHADAHAEARDQAHRAACAFGPILATYDSTTIDAYFAAVLDHATGEWKKEFAATSKDLRDVLTQGHVVATAGTVHCAIGSTTDTTAEAIVIIDQSITSVGTQGQPRRGQLALTLTLRKSGNRWLIDKLDSPALQP